MAGDGTVAPTVVTRSFSKPTGQVLDDPNREQLPGSPDENANTPILQFEYHVG